MTSSATLMKIRGKVGGPSFSLYRQGTDGDCPPDPLVNADLSITASGNPSIGSSLSDLAMTACNGGQCVHSSIESISALPDGTDLLFEILIEDENIAASTEWSYYLVVRYLYVER